MTEWQLGSCSTFVDDDVLILLSDYYVYAHWSGRKGRKAYQTVSCQHRKTGKTVTLARLILGIRSRKHLADHISGDTLDNRRANLRIVTVRQNSMNRRCRNSTGYKGVSRKGHGYQAVIWLRGKKYYCGFSNSAWKAGQAYNKKALELFGEYAKLNP